MAKIREKPRPEITADGNLAPKGRQLFQPGNKLAVGNPGRPKGTRVRLNEAFFRALHEEFERRGVEAMQALTDHEFIRVIASQAPSQLQVETEQTIYVLSDRPITGDEWAAKYADPAPPTIEARPVDEKVH